MEKKRTDPTTQMAVLASSEALQQAGLEIVTADARRNMYTLANQVPHDTGVFVGTGAGGICSQLDEIACIVRDDWKRRLQKIVGKLDQKESNALENLFEEEVSMYPQRLNPFSVAMSMPNAIAANLAIKFGLTGPCRTLNGACASGTIAVGHAFHAIRNGECNLALAAGVDFMGDPYGACFRGFDALDALVGDELPPDSANRPFDANRSGFLFSQGGCAVLVIEELEHALTRGARPLAEILGYGETCDAYNTIVIDPKGTEIRRLFHQCLAQADLSTDAIQYINGHGTGTQANDSLECELIQEVFGSNVRVNSTKSLLGHTMGASGAIEILVTILTLVHGRTHPCRNLEIPIGNLAFSKDTKPFPVRNALSHSFAFGGQNAAVAIGRS
jgi:3-oxoacyl-[acyl-carrier-protein] synthase II